MVRLLARIWRGLRGPAQWWILWAAHAQFIAGITGLVRNDAGHVLLLRHRLWPPGYQWGLPTGYAKRRETFEATIVREVREETGLDVTAGPLIQLTSVATDWNRSMSLVSSTGVNRRVVRVNPTMSANPTTSVRVFALVGWGGEQPTGGRRQVPPPGAAARHRSASSPAVAAPATPG